MITTTALAFFMRFRHNRRMEPKPPILHPPSSILAASAPPGHGALPLDDASAARTAERILAELWNEFAISATLKVKTNLNRAAEREFNRLRKVTSDECHVAGNNNPDHQPSTLNPQPRLLRATAAPGHAVPKLGAPGPNPLRNAEANAKAETMFAELWREFAPDAVAAILQHFNRAHDRGVKGQTVRGQVARAAGAAIRPGGRD